VKLSADPKKPLQDACLPPLPLAAIVSAMTTPADILSRLLRQRRSIRDFLPTPIPDDMLNAILEDANNSPSWSNTQPYRIAIASGDCRDRLARSLTANFDAGMKAVAGGPLGKLKLWLGRDGLPDGDFQTSFEYPNDLQPARRATGFGLYNLLGIARHDVGARNAQMRCNFEFFGAPTALFFFVHGGLREFSVLDAGILLQTVMLSAEARGLATCAQGALATWGGPVRGEFAVPDEYKLICGMSMGYASDHSINAYNPGRGKVTDLLLAQR
jgi:nitroreductase